MTPEMRSASELAIFPNSMARLLFRD